MAIERTLIIIKPDGVERNLTEDILKRYQDAGLTLLERKELTPETNLLKQHYSEHVEKPFYVNLEEFMASGPVVVAIFEGENAVTKARKVTGATNPAEAAEGTIRGDLRDTTLTGEDGITKNMVHASATVEESKKEIALWFPGH